MNKEIEIAHTIKDSEGIFEAREKGIKVGELTYWLQGEKCMVINHTEVNEKRKGRGIARLLVEAAVLHAKKKSYQILPKCSYVKVVFDRVAEYQGLLYKGK